MAEQTARQSDINGYIEIDGNPISKVGVFPYLGREIGAADPSKVYYVYRPEEELSSPETIESFKLMPLVDEHAMLGSEDDGYTPAERKGVQGVIGESVYYEAPYLKAKLKIFSESAKRMVATGEKIELSPGYRCRYEFTSGEFNGQKYDAIQRSLIGNHLALVTEGRTGPDVAVLDHAGGLLCALDSNSLQEAVMADENKQDVEVKDDLDQLKKSVAALSDEERAELLKAFASDEAVEAAEEAIEAAEKAIEAVTEAAEEVKEAAEELKTATDSTGALKKLVNAQKKLAKAKGAPVNVVAMDAAPVVAMDEKAIVAMIADRDGLARKVSGFVGSFDHSSMTSSQVAEYAVSKLGIQAPKGSERIALDGWLHGRTPDHQQPTFSADGGMKKVNLAALRSKK